MTNYGHMPLQTSIIQLLKADANLAAMVAGIYDRVPQKTAFPYIQLFKWAMRDYSSASADGQLHEIELHIWGRKAGMAQTAAIAGRVYDLLHLEPLTVSGHEVIWIRCVASRTELDDDGASYATVMQFEAFTQEIS